jgi:Methyltransferase domain
MPAFTDEPRHAEDLHAWHVLRPLLDVGPYLPWSSGAMRPAGLVTVCNAIVSDARTSVVECGSGASTVLLARLLRERGAGTLVSIEHDAGWAALTTDLLRRERLDAAARVVHAPLTGDPPWYAPEPLEGALPDSVDLLVVDGPPAFEPGHEHRREPALGFFEERLADGAAVVLDDLQRAGEREVLARWEARGAWRFQVHEAAGVAVGTRA